MTVTDVLDPGTVGVLAETDVLDSGTVGSVAVTGTLEEDDGPVALTGVEGAVALTGVVAEVLVTAALDDVVLARPATEIAAVRRGGSVSPPAVTGGQRQAGTGERGAADEGGQRHQVASGQMIERAHDALLGRKWVVLLDTTRRSWRLGQPDPELSSPEPDPGPELDPESLPEPGPELSSLEPGPELSSLEPVPELS